MSVAILHLIRSLDPAAGGPVEYLKQVAKAQKAVGVDTAILTLQPSEPAWMVNLPGSVIDCGPSRGVYGFNRDLEQRLSGIAGSFKAMVVHGLWQFHGISAARATAKTGTPYFIFPHGMLDPWFRKEVPLKHFKKQLYWFLAERRILEGAKSVIFTSRQESERARATFWPPANYRPRIVPLGVPRPLAKLEQARETFFTRFPHLLGKSFLLYLGRIHPKKGCHLLIETMVRLRFPINLVMAGPSSDLTYLGKLKRTAGDSFTTFTGLIEGELKAGALAAATALILPSHQENFGLVVAEALSFGTPVLISRQVNIAEDIESAGAGFVEPDTLEGTQRLIERWVRSGNPAMRQAAFDCYQKHFQIESSAEKLLKVIVENA